MRRMSMLALALMTEACAGTVVPESGASPDMACEWDVCVYEARSRGAIQMWAHNAEPVAATVTLSFDFVQNVRITEALPMVRVVPAGQRVLLAQLPRVRPTGDIAAHPVVAIDLGSDSTEPDPDVLYSVPFGGSKPRQLIEGYGGATHLGTNYYAVDFAMPRGTPVLAARSGIVVDVQDGFTQGGLRPELLQRANLVAIAHTDGTLASYGHLRRGLRVAEGDTVSRGQLLGFSGSTGFSGRPHLHFHVGKRLMGGHNRTIPFMLRGPDGASLEPMEGAWYEPASQATPGGGPETGADGC